MAAGAPAETEMEPPTTRTRVRAILEAGNALAGHRVVVGGWVRAGREQGCGRFAFLDVNDGSCLGNFQVKVDAVTIAPRPLARLTATGTSVLVEGELQADRRAKHGVELSVERVIEVGEVDAAAYPLPKTKPGHPLDPAYLR